MWAFFFTSDVYAFNLNDVLIYLIILSIDPAYFFSLHLLHNSVRTFIKKIFEWIHVLILFVIINAMLNVIQTGKQKTVSHWEVWINCQRHFIIGNKNLSHMFDSYTHFLFLNKLKKKKRMKKINKIQITSWCSRVQSATGCWWIYIRQLIRIVNQNFLRWDCLSMWWAQWTGDWWCRHFFNKKILFLFYKN